MQTCDVTISSCKSKFFNYDFYFALQKNLPYLVQHKRCLDILEITNKNKTDSFDSRKDYYYQQSENRRRCLRHKKTEATPNQTLTSPLFCNQNTKITLCCSTQKRTTFPDLNQQITAKHQNKHKQGTQQQIRPF